MAAYLGVDLGGTNIRTVLTDDAAGVPRILARDTRPTPRSGPDDIVAALAASARAALKGAPAAGEVVALGCAAPGPLDHRSGIVHHAPNLVGVRDLPLAASLSAALDGLAVSVDRDTAVALIGEVLAGAARGARDVVYVTVSTGLGGAILSDGRVLRGATATAGEIGHWPVGLEGPRCGCGSFGCAESFAAGRSLAEQFGVDDAESVFAAARAGDPIASRLVERAEAALGGLAIGLVNVLNPALIVVGGAIAENQPGHVLPAMARAIEQRAFRAPASAVRVVPAALGADVGPIGAVLMARERAAGRGEWFL